MAASVLQDKYTFFSNLPDDNQRSLAYARAQIENLPYADIEKYIPSIELSFKNLFETLQKNEHNRDKFWLYSYYCCSLLQSYYTTYGKKESAEKYSKLSQQISERFQPALQSQRDKNGEEGFIFRLVKQLSADLSGLVSAPFHSVNIKNWMGLVNITRMQLIFSRLFLMQASVALNEVVLIEKLLGGYSDLDKLLASLNQPVGVFNALSVGAFAVRFAMDVGEVLKNTLSYPEQTSLSLAERFKNEMNERHCEMLNDLVWGIVNGVSNYAPYFNINQMVANWGMTAFILFDLSLQVYAHQQAEQTYFEQMDGYVAELAAHPEYRNILNEQIDVLELNWKITQAKFGYNITGSILLGSGLSAALLLSAPAAVSAGFLVSTVAVAMFLSADQYGAYQGKKDFLADKSDISLQEEEEISQAQSELFNAMAKNTISPIVFMGVSAVSWPAALLLSALYAGYGLGEHYLAIDDDCSTPKPRHI